MAILEGDRRTEAEAIVARYPKGRERSAVMPLLYLVQSIEGWVTREGLQEVAALLGLRTAEVEAVATFYTMYRLRPTGTHVVNVCTNLACKLRGAEAVFEAAHQAAEMAHGQERSEDGLLTLHEEECLGLCDVAPAVQINLANHDAVTPERMRELVGALRRGEVPPVSQGRAYASFKEASRALAGLEVGLEVQEVSS